MAITRTQAEKELVSRTGKRMEIVGMAVTVIGSNGDLNGPLAYALRCLGMDPDETVTDANLALVSIGEVDEFYDRAELRLLQNIQGNFTLNDISLGPKDEKLSQLGTQLETIISRKAAGIQKAYGSVGGLEFGNLYHDFQAKLPEDEIG